MDVTIRPIEKRDNAGVASMIRGVFDEYGAQTKGTVYEDPTTDNLFGLFNGQKAILYILEFDNVVHGCCGIFPTQGLPEGTAELVKFYISSEVRGKGFGQTLFRMCEDSAIELGYDQLYIESTQDFIKAVKMYEKMGFEWLETPMGDSGHGGCNIWMLKKLGN